MSFNFRRCSVPLWVLLHCVLARQGSPVSIETLPKDVAALRQAKWEEMRRYMNESVDPCDNFYEFVCGKYVDDTNTSSTMPSLSTIVDVYDAQLQAELEVEDVARDTDVDRKLKRFYKSCLNLQATVDESKQKRRQLIKEVGQMPVLMAGKWLEDDFDWEKTVADIVHETGFATIFGIGAITDFNNNSRQHVGIFEPKFTEPSINLYSLEAYRDRRFAYTVHAAHSLETILGVQEDEALQTAKELLEFEILLAQGKVDKLLGLQNSEIYNLTTIDDMQRRYWPDLDTKKLLSSALEFTPNELYVDHRYVELALHAIKTTPKRIVANYIYFRYFEDTYHLPAVDGIWWSGPEEACSHSIQQMFYKQLDNMMYRHYISDQMKQEVHVLGQAVKGAFQAALQQSPRLNWIQEDTRKYALHKLKAMNLTILSFELNNFTQELSAWQPDDRDYLGNIVALAAVRGNRTRAVFNEPVPAEDDGFAASYVPSYSPVDNLLKIPVAYALQYHKYATSYPNAVNFGTLGAFIGHEMLHGFDDAGRKYDAQGNSLNWWDAQSVAEFDRRTQCFTQQYKRYKIDGQALPEMKLQAENISDNGGIRAAYAAYLKWLDNAVASKHQSLALESFPDLNYTSQQLFFIAYGQSWCTTYEPEISDLASAVHVPARFRVIGTLSNLDEFAQQFNCPRGSAMNPVDKCEIY